MFLTVFMKFLQNHVLISLLFLILVFTCIYFWNYIRVCYYVSKLPGPPAYPIIGNAKLFLGSHQEITHKFINIAGEYQQTMFRVWFGPFPIIGISNPDIVQELLTNEHVLEKAYLFKLAWNPVMGKSILTSEVPEWKHHRSIIIRGFTPIILKSYFKNVINNNELINVKAINSNVYKKPFLDYLMDFTKNNSNFTEEQLRNETNLMIFAGYETTAISLSYVLLHLAVYKDIQTKLYNEILEVVGDINVDSINVDDLPRLKYMDMVLKESMRIISTIPVISREASKDIKIGNYTIPKGTNILIPIFTIHRNPEYWENPLKFDPERFTAENIKNRHPYVYIPFGAGPRNCIGGRYAWIFMKTTLVALLSRYEFHTDINLDTLQFEAAISMKLINGYPVRITPRYKP
ncbi:probable cytochrome P450 313a4 [Chrysoperla carnea]|uniref:probable cytochrome P450 313a4 n=1 Tax=Chrysoperla carnea TaxID=189513 RepID=UPI001D07DBB5|nr:probable cytochrome P450 313a4 [Chrysoperla carnea]